MRVYTQLKSRFLPDFLFLGIIVDPDITEGMAWLLVFLPIAPLLLFYALTVWRRRWHVLTSPALVLAFGGLLVGLLGLSTDSELRIVEAPASLVGALLLLLADSDEQKRLNATMLRAPLIMLV